MKIQKINYADSYTRIPQVKPNYFYKTTGTSSDTINFKGLGTSLTILVARQGYKALKSDLAKANFKNEIGPILAKPDRSYNGKKLVNVLFALAKTSGKKEPNNIIYAMKDKYDFKKTMKDSTNKKLRIGKLNKIFMKKIIKTT